MMRRLSARRRVNRTALACVITLGGGVQLSSARLTLARLELASFALQLYVVNGLTGNGTGEYKTFKSLWLLVFCPFLFPGICTETTLSVVLGFICLKAHWENCKKLLTIF
ncbi:hypothetical protein ACOSQ4_011963 [Xanthoceras sorbifolium]